MNIPLIQVDGKLPNLALMKLAHFHRERGDAVVLARSAHPDLFGGRPDRVYASVVFKKSAKALDEVRAAWPDAILGGTGSESTRTVEEEIGAEHERYDYSIYPEYAHSLGFTQRGCRLRCSFCVVPAKEGRPRSVNRIADIWRGDPHPRNVVLPDNDFFGQPKDSWRARIREIRDGGFKVSFNQGLNVRLIDDEGAESLAGVRYYDDNFKMRRLYTAWDNLGDEKIYWRGVDRLERVGIPPHHLLTYMLIGYSPGETWDQILYRWGRMNDRKINVFPMVYSPARGAIPYDELKWFQRWAVRKYFQFVPWKEFTRERRRQMDREGGREPEGQENFL